MIFQTRSKPFLHGIPGSSRFKPPARDPLHCVRTKCMKVGCTGANPAAMKGTERNYRLSGKIIALQKCTDNPWSLPVPYCVSKLIQIFSRCYRLYIYGKRPKINTFQKGRCTHAWAGIVLLFGFAALSVFHSVKFNDNPFFKVAIVIFCTQGIITFFHHPFPFDLLFSLHQAVARHEQATYIL